MNTVRALFALLLFSSVMAEDIPPTSAEMTKRISALESQLAAMKAGSISYKTLAELEVDLSFFSFSDEATDKIPDRLIRFLSLTDTERKGVSEAIRDVRKQITEQIALSKPAAVKTTDGYRLEVGDFSAEGKILEGIFLKRAGETLGPDRLRLFRRCLRSWNDRWFFDFGQKTQIYTFSNRAGAWFYRHESKGDGGSSSSNSSLNSLREFAIIRPFLPKDLIDAVEGKKPEPENVNDF